MSVAKVLAYIRALGAEPSLVNVPLYKYVVEYDENSCAWLVDVATKARVPLAHGTVLDVGDTSSPRVPPKEAP